MTRLRTLAISLLLVSYPATCPGDIIDMHDVGEGFFTSTVQVDFANGNGYLFNVRWSSGGTTGWDLMLTIAEELDEFQLDYSESEWGVFLQGIEAFGDADWGVGAGWPEVEDYWHYWTRESASEEWLFAPIGADVRSVSDGSWDGWVFLSPDAPQPAGVPAPGGVLLAALALGSRRRRR